MEVVFETGGLIFDADFNDTPASKEIIENLPLESKVRTWGDEIYFDIGINASSEGAGIDVDVGDVGYWPDGKCLCVFFGATPSSNSDKPVHASPVVIVGKTGISPDE